MGTVESTVARFRQTLRHIAEHLTPDFVRAHNADCGARDRLDIRCDSLLDPVMAVFDRRKAEMNHLVDEFPIALKVLPGRGAAHRYLALGPAFTETFSIGNASPV